MKSDSITHNFTVEIKPDNVSDIYKKVYFKSYEYDKVSRKDISENAGLDIDWKDGVASAVRAGYSTVWAYTYGFDSENNKLTWEYKDSFVVETKNVFPIFTLNDRRIVLGSPYKLSITPKNSSKVTYAKYEYISSDEDIASIDSLGNITPHKKGKTIITVSLDDGFYNMEESFELTVDTKVMEDTMTKKSFSKFVRKGLSHFMGFVVFGLISSFMFLLFINTNYDGNKKLSIVVTIINGVVFASLTEFIQIFAIDRTAQFKDIAIDYLGYMLAVIISFSIISITYLIKKHKQKQQKI